PQRSAPPPDPPPFPTRRSSDLLMPTPTFVPLSGHRRTERPVALDGNSAVVRSSLEAPQAEVGLETGQEPVVVELGSVPGAGGYADRKSTRLNSSHSQISYAVFC